jgi:hypothetical protein
MRQWLPRALEVMAWLAAAVMLAVCATQWFSTDTRIVIAIVQALMPWMVGAAVAIVAVALTCKRLMLALAFVPVLATGLVLAAPLVLHPSPASTTGSEATLSVFFVNALYSNQTPAAAAAVIAGSGADVLVIGEFTPDLRNELDAAAAADYPYRVEQPAPPPSSNGIAVWSRLPFEAGTVIDLAGRPTADVRFSLGGVPVRLLGIHTAPPTHDAGYWSRQLQSIGEHAAGSDVRTLLIGDFNGSRWHPSFRALLRRGFTDTHEALGKGWSVSWPTDEGWFPPPFVRLDHALYGHGLSPLGVRDVSVPGSDHRGFIATFAVIEP